jgi:hypothetical protein
MKSIKKIIYVLIFQSLLFAPSMVKAYGLEGHLSILNIANECSKNNPSDN